MEETLQFMPGWGLELSPDVKGSSLRRYRRGLANLHLRAFLKESSRAKCFRSLESEVAMGLIQVEVRRYSTIRRKRENRKQHGVHFGGYSCLGAIKIGGGAIRIG